MPIAKYTNQEGLPLSMAVWLASDYYDYQRAGLSVTTLLKPIKQTILGKRVAAEAAVTDIMGLVQNRMGAALHDSIEKAWVQNFDNALKDLGVAGGLRRRVRINPTPEEAKEDGIIPVYLEQRSQKEVHGIPVSGQFDFVGDGMVEDFKSTTVYSYIMGSKDSDYILQGSMYRWLRPDIITKDQLRINFIFTDWSKANARQQPQKYPQSRIANKVYNLLPLAETERWVSNRVQTLLDLWDADEEKLPDCTAEELWRSDPVYKYYKDPKKTTRSTKNFDSKAEAMIRFVEDGSVGLVKEVPGEVKACLYCPAFPICKQKDALIASGDLNV